jgi:hypothetical protein
MNRNEKLSKDATTAHISGEYQNLFIYRICIFVVICIILSKIANYNSIGGAGNYF